MAKNTRTTLGSSGDFDNTPTTLCALPIEEAEKIWADYLARCPGSYLECMANGRGEERARWVLEGVDLEAQVTVARALNGTKVHRPHHTLPAAPSKSRKPATHFLDMMKVHMRLMERHKPGSPEWSRERSNASAYRSQAVRRALEDGVELEIPILPRAPRRPFGREARHA